MLRGFRPLHWQPRRRWVSMKSLIALQTNTNLPFKRTVTHTHTHTYTYMMQGCHTPPPPPLPMVSPLACQVGSCLVWACCFSRLLLFGLVPSPPCGVGPVVFLVGPAPPVGGAVCSTEVWYGCCHLLVAMSSLRALSPPPPVGWGACGRFGWPRPACVGQCVLQRYGMVAATC